MSSTNLYSKHTQIQTHACNPTTWEVEEGESMSSRLAWDTWSPWVQGQSGPHGNLDPDSKSKFFLNQSALSFAKSKQPEAIPDSQISVLNRPLLKHKLTVSLNTSLKHF